MELYFPNSAFLGNIESFLTRLNLTDETQLNVAFNPNWVSVHPVVLSAAAALGKQCMENNVPINCTEMGPRSIGYFVRMGLFDFLNLDNPQELQFHEESGRFIPLRCIRDNQELSQFISDMVPLLHADPSTAYPIKYVVSELIRNVLEHSASTTGALICAQYFKKRKRLSIGVADRGVGIERTIRQSHQVNSTLQALNLALRPGITGTTSRIGGTEYNAGAGLFFTRNIAKATKNYFYIHSGRSYYKQLVDNTNNRNQLELFPDPFYDKCTKRDKSVNWKGTLVGIDMSADSENDFELLLKEIRDIYRIDVKERRKERYKKPRFQ